MRVCTVGFGGATAGGVVGVVVVAGGVLAGVVAVGGVVVVVLEGAACVAPVFEAEVLAKAAPGAATAARAQVRAMSVLVFTEVKSSQRRGLPRRLSIRLHETRYQVPDRGPGASRR
jgi:hypothetical protein